MDTFVFKCSPSVFYVGELMLLSAGPGRPKLWNARGDMNYNVKHWRSAWSFEDYPSLEPISIHYR
jgi:hypothetical protein